MTHPALPPRVSAPWIATAIAVWVVAGVWNGSVAQAPIDGEFEGSVVLSSDARRGRFGWWALGRIDSGVVLVQLDGHHARGDRLEVQGYVEGDSGSVQGRPYGGVLAVDEVTSVEPSRFWPHVAGRIVRATVLRRLEPFDDGRALLAGFLIGDTSHMSAPDVEAMRRSGLAHFTAVSGSNVALFLGLLFVAAGPMALAPRRRAVIGLLGLPIYTAATGFEPSVIRASVMASIALSGRLVGIVLEAWQLLALAVVLVLVWDPAMTSNVGFQLSVAATAGVLVGARWPVDTRVGRALAVTLGAQIAVAPLLLSAFGSVPLLSPLVNLVAAPLVTIATLVGAVGSAGLTFLIGPASALSSLVLTLARGAQSWPQFDVPFALGMALVAAVAIRWPHLLRMAVVPTAVAFAVVIVGTGETLPGGSVAVLDVGQGDAILIHGGAQRYALIDGGPDPVVILDKLRQYGVTSLELVVLTHVHADHATGLAAVVESVAVGEIWANPGKHRSASSAQLMDVADRQGVRVSSPESGVVRALGDLTLRVEGPLRRYKSPNDESIVLTVAGPNRTMLLSGDIETFAQTDLSHLRADVLKVPHQGAGTSDPDWLASVGAEVAVISVGPNQFGHPVPWVIDTLEAEGAQVMRTDEDGDVVIRLGP